jgi:hypothetical protein
MPEEDDDFTRRLLAPHFDARFYLASNPDVAKAGVDPFGHFLSNGWREGRDPNSEFSVRYYLRVNSDVQAAGVNPLFHYVAAGRQEGRKPRRPMDAERAAIEAASPVAERAKHWGGAADTAVCLAQEGLVRRLTAALTGNAGLVVAIGHDDYELNIGGVQKLTLEERLGFEAIGCAYMHLSPAAPLPRLAPEGIERGTFRFAVRLGTERVGPVLAADVLAAVATLRRNGLPVLVIIHHLLGLPPEDVAAIASLGSIPAVFWAHDYFVACPNYTLLRNDVRYCGAPPIGSAACAVCVHGEERLASLPRVQALFDALRPVLLAPSETALRLWIETAALPHRVAAVQPLARLVLDTRPSRARSEGPLRIAHLGMRTIGKGWPVFEKLAMRFRDDPRYAFFQLGLSSPGIAPGHVQEVPVKVTRGTPDAMIEAVAANRIDVVISWSPGPETFCYAAHEGIAGGAFLITHPGAGNVPAMIDGAGLGQGLVLPDEAALHSLFAGTGLNDAIASCPRRRGVLIPEGGTAAWLLRAETGSLFRAQLRDHSRCHLVET